MNGVFHLIHQQDRRRWTLTKGEQDTETPEGSLRDLTRIQLEIAARRSLHKPQHTPPEKGFGANIDDASGNRPKPANNPPVIVRSFDRFQDITCVSAVPSKCRPFANLWDCSYVCW
jgi:hypothetical protein